MIERVVIDDTASPTEIARVAEVFRGYGFEVAPQPTYARRSAELLPWVLQVLLAAPIGAFFVSFGSEAGKDTYEAVKDWIEALWRARKGAGAGHGSVELVDPDGTHVVASSTIPERALPALRDVDWSKERGSYLIWDETKGRWYDPMRTRPYY
jgi:hypothetical protein